MKDETWDDYQRETGNGWSDRDDFADAIDLHGLVHSIAAQRLNGTSKWDAYGQYLNYHEGWGGYWRGSYRSKGRLMKVSCRRPAPSATVPNTDNARIGFPAGLVLLTNQESEMPLLDSFTVDHTRMAAPCSAGGQDHADPEQGRHHGVRPAFLRAEPGRSSRAWHPYPLEHLFAGFMRDHLNGNGVGDHRHPPMGCRTGFSHEPDRRAG